MCQFLLIFLLLRNTYKPRNNSWLRITRKNFTLSKKLSHFLKTLILILSYILMFSKWQFKWSLIILKIYGKNILKSSTSLNALKLGGITTTIKTSRYINKLDSSKAGRSSKRLLKELNVNFLTTKSMKSLTRNIDLGNL